MATTSRELGVPMVKHDFDNICEAAETVNHLFIHCPFASKLWWLTLVWRNVTWVGFSSVKCWGSHGEAYLLGLESVVQFLLEDMNVYSGNMNINLVSNQKDIVDWIQAKDRWETLAKARIDRWIIWCNHAGDTHYRSQGVARHIAAVVLDGNVEGN
ncbi:hypothetical protein PIB30_050802 [Stylosanthes scabra]|uniref:Reverse transcriptase zinc-binding domain-containing protein n=1 Tax=Stylosanthes scabra TaxID=79078 RepID=A0ABU6RIG0_9FABA|nr:hypothetical protein [Stylosanthes scabra]